MNIHNSIYNGEIFLNMNLLRRLRKFYELPIRWARSSARMSDIPSEFSCSENITVYPPKSLEEFVPTGLKQRNYTGIRNGIADCHIPETDGIQQVNSHTTAIIGTFNIEWLGSNDIRNMKRTDEDYGRIAQVIIDSGACLLGIQEIADMDGLHKVMGHLPGWGYIVGRQRKQMLGIIFRKDRVKYDLNSIDELETVSDPKEFHYEDLRPPLIAYIKVDNFDCNLLVVHQKSNRGFWGVDGNYVEGQNIRNRQGRKLGEWITGHLRRTNDKDLILLGDFNDQLGSTSLFNVDIGQNMRFVSAEAFAKRIYSHRGRESKRLIDHIALSDVKGGAMEEYVEGSLKTIDEDKYPNYKSSVSDHKPILIELRTDIDND